MSTLKEICKENKDGFTLDMKTGNHAEHKIGYYVSMTNNIIDKHDTGISFDIFLKCFNMLQNMCDKQLYIGGWFDGSKYFLDITFHIKTESMSLARTLGREFGQDSIYSVKEQRSIPIY